jgi:hypothetical protein
VFAPLTATKVHQNLKQLQVFTEHEIISFLCVIVPFRKNTQFHSSKSPTRCNSFPIYYPDVYLQLNMFRAFSRPLSGAQWRQWQPLVLTSYRGDSRAVFVVGPVDTALPGTHCTGGWVGPRAGLDKCGKSRPPPGFDPRTVQPVVSRYIDWATRPTFIVGINVK